MVLVKILGAIDLASAIAFLMLIFGISVFPQFILFCAFLLLVKGLFIITGDVLSVLDLFSSIILLSTLFLTPFSILLWIPAFFLLGKGVISFA